MSRRSSRPPVAGDRTDTVLAVFLLAVAAAAVVLFGAVQWSYAGPVFLALFLLAGFQLARMAVFSSGRSWCSVPALGWLLLVPLYILLRVYWRGTSPVAARSELVLVCGYLAAYAIWAQLPGVGARWRFWIGAFLFVSALVSMYAIALHLRGDRSVLWLIRPETYGMRASGTFGSPNHFAHFLAISFSFALAMVLSVRAGGGLRMVAGYAGLMNLVALFLTLSRGGAAAAVFAALVVPGIIAARSGRRTLALAALVLPLLLGGGGWAIWNYSTVWQERATELNVDGQLRPRMWRDTLRIWKAEPWLGFGPGSFPYTFSEYRVDHFEPDQRPLHAHSEPLELLAEYGLLGALLVLGGGAWALYRILRLHLRGEAKDADIAWAAGLSGAWGGSLVHALVDFNFHIPANVLLLFSLTGLALARLHASGRIRTVPADNRFRVGLAGVGVLACLVLAWHSWRFGRVGHWQMEWRQAAVERKSESGLEPARRAARLDPAFSEAHVYIGETLQRQAFWLRRQPQQMAPLIEEAEKHVEQALRLNHRDLDARIALARIRVLQGRPDDAEREAAEVIRLCPKLVYYRLEQARILVDAGRSEAALKAFQSARELDPYNESAWAGVHSMKRKLGLPILQPHPPPRPTPKP